MADLTQRLREKAHHRYTGTVTETLLNEAADEIGRLTAELEDYKTNGASAVRWAPSSSHWSNELQRLFRHDAREGIAALERHRSNADHNANEAAKLAVKLSDELNALKAQLNLAHGRILDMYANDDGQAWVETGKYIDRYGLQK